MKISLQKVLLLIACMCIGAYSKKLDTLAIEGLFIQQPYTVYNAVPLKKGAEFTSADMQSALKNLYRLGVFRSVDLYVTKEADSSASLLCKVVEYPLIESIEYSGNKKLKQKDFEEKMTMKKGQVISDALLFDNVSIIGKLYSQKGYLLAEVKPELIPTKVPGNVIVKLNFKEGDKVVVRQVAFKGNVDMKESKLKSKFKTKEKKLFWGGDFDQDLYKSHLDSLIMFYNDEGYVDARIVRDTMWYADNKKDIHIEIEVNEGKKYYAGDFFFSGNKILETSRLAALVALGKGKPFQKSKFDETREFITNAYREEGYLWVQVKDRQSFRGDTIDVTFDINESKPAIVRKIAISGNTKTKDKVIRRELKIFPGEKYKQSLMMRSVRDVNQLNFFSNVKPDLSPNDDGTVDLDFGVTEKDNIGQFSVGAAYSQLESFMGTLNLSIPNFRGEGEKLDLGLQLGEQRQNVSLNFSEPWAFNSPTTLYGGISYDKTKWINSSWTESYGFSGGIGRQLRWPDDYFSARVDYDLMWKEDYDTISTDFSNGIHLHPRGLESKLGLTIRRDDTDMPTFPSQGSIISLSPQIAGLGGDYRYLKTILSYDSYYPVFWKFVIGAHTKYGVINALPWSPGGDIPIDRYSVLSAGGVWYTDGIIRGYTDMSFGGRSYPEYGKAMLALSSELRFPVLEQTLYFSVFGDAGNTWTGVENINPADLYPGAGFGVRLLVPMLGLMGFDFGYGFKKQGVTDPFSADANKWQFHFQMGKGF